MNNITITFSTLPATMNKPRVPEVKQGADPACQPKKSGLSTKERQKDARSKKKKSYSDLHPAPTAKEIADRWRILQQEHNLLMLKLISHRYVRGPADRDTLATDLLLDLVEADCNTPLAEACALLDSPDGARGRGRAHTIISNVAHTRARSLITVRHREVSSDFTEVQRQAVTAAVKGDGQATKVNYDSRSTINRELDWQSGDPAGRSWTDDEFRRRAERISEIDGGSFMYKGKVFRESIRIHKERSLVDMLNEPLRIGGLHDNGRVDRDDAYIMKDWQRRFFNMRDVTVDEKMQDWTIEVMKRARRLGTVKGRQWCLMMYKLNPGCWSEWEKMVLSDIVRGDVTGMGTLVASCTWATQKRVGGTKKAVDSTDEYMLVRYTTICKMLGLEATSTNRSRLSKLFVRMAEQAGATAQYDTLGGAVSQQERFPYKVPPVPTSVSKGHWRVATAVGQCGCMNPDNVIIPMRLQPCATCRTKAGLLAKQRGGVSFWADRETNVVVHGIRSDFALLGATYGAVHDLVCFLSGMTPGSGANQFVPFEQYRQGWMASVMETDSLASGAGLGVMQSGF